MIDKATNGDTMFVYNGTYFENIKTSKKIILILENKIQLLSMVVEVEMW